MKQRQRRQEEYDKKGNMKETSREDLTGDEPGSSIGLYFRIFRTLLPFQINSIARTCYRHLLCTRTPSTNIYIISSNFAALQQYI
jgi:hypothetical protein